MVLGLGTIVYARQSVPADDSSPPTDQRPLARRVRVLPVRHVGAARRQPRGAEHAPAAHRALPADRHPQPRRRRHPLAPVHVERGRQAGQAGRVPRRLRRRARQRLAEVPRQPTRRQGVHRGRDQVRHRGRRAAGRRVGLLHRHRRRHHLHRQLRQHPDQERTGWCSRSRSCRATPTSRCRRGPPTWWRSARPTANQVRPEDLGHDGPRRHVGHRWHGHRWHRHRRHGHGDDHRHRRHGHGEPPATTTSAAATTTVAAVTATSTP